MESAFGIDHGGVSKSFVGGKFVRATELSAKQTKKVKAGGQYKKAKGTTKSDAEFKRIHEGYALKAALPQMKGVTKENVPSASGFTMRTGSKSSGKSYVAGAAPTKKLVNRTAHHEAQHADVKRSSYRLHSQIMGKPKKLFKEEARADWHSFGHYGNKKNDSGYAMAARAQKAIKSGDGKKPYKGLGLGGLSNKQVRTNVFANIDANTPQYRLSEGKRGKKAVKAYTKLQDDFQARGVPRKKQP